jgi:hypothetical protein
MLCTEDYLVCSNGELTPGPVTLKATVSGGDPDTVHIVDGAGVVRSQIDTLSTTVVAGEWFYAEAVRSGGEMVRSAPLRVRQ